MNKSEWYEILKERVNTAELSLWVGQRLSHVSRGKAHVTLSIENHHLQRRGQLHAGWYGFIADTAGFFAVMSLCGQEDLATTVEYKINLIASATPEDSPVTARARVIRRSGFLAVTAMEVVASRGTVLATALGTYRIFPGTSPQQANITT
ncbi:MAG: PaaI family thioesterase [candidate division WOR-3 bacterium]